MRNKMIMTTASMLALSGLVNAAHNVTLHPEKTKQVIQGIGFEIQSDSIGSGNLGLPENRLAVPHDLVPSERDRLSTEMLKGFRYCRLAGGLYWRGLDPEEKYLQPRWPEQLEELRRMLDLAGVEGLSLEYWSPAPYWKSTGSYIGGTLRCFGKDFDDDPVYKGDTERFLKDFSYAIVKDIKTLEAAGIKVSMWGLQNEPHISNNSYSTCKYHSSSDYVLAYTATAGAVRKHDPSIMLFSDTGHGYPKFIGPAMNDDEVAALVDAYCVHTIGWDSERVQGVHDKIRKKLPHRPWFQNEYEYLTGGATPDRCLNTVQHIMNSFQLGENPTWYWIHALKPFKNSEASGYSLGFWNSRTEPKKSPNDAAKKCRWTDGPEYTVIPEELADADYVSVMRAKGDKEHGRDFSVIVEGSSEVYLVASEELSNPPKGFVITDLYTEYGDGQRDVIYKTTVSGREHFNFPANHTKSGGKYAPPHAVFVKPFAGVEVSGLPRTSDKFSMKSLPVELAGATYVIVSRGEGGRPGKGYSFSIDKPSKIYLAVQDRGTVSSLDGWDKEELSAAWDAGGTFRDTIYSRTFKAGTVQIPKHNGKDSAGYYGIPHMAFVAAPEAKISGLGRAETGRVPAEKTVSEVQLKPGVNSPIRVRSESMKAAEIMAQMKPGHWIYNDYNWNAVGSFVKRMPWDSVAIDLTDHAYSKNAKAFCFKRPNGKLTVVLSNRSSNQSHTFSVATGLPAGNWKGYRYSPEERGENTMGVPVGMQDGAVLTVELEPRSWEFWEQQ